MKKSIFMMSFLFSVVSYASSFTCTVSNVEYAGGDDYYAQGVKKHLEGKKLIISDEGGYSIKAGDNIHRIVLASLDDGSHIFAAGIGQKVLVKGLLENCKY